MANIWSSIPFAYRLAALFALLGAIALWDWKKNHTAATKWREYSFLLFAALLGAAFGMINDTVTSRLSREYFLYGKGLAEGTGFFADVLALGFQAGFGAGLIAGAFYLFANNPKPNRPTLSYRQLLKYIGRPIFAAVFLAVAFGISSNWLVGPRTDPALNQALGLDHAVWFWRVWYIHLGLYAGLTIGTVWGIISIHRSRH